MTDATGREIVIGRRYAYSQTSNGNFWIVKGTAFKFTETKVTLSDIREKRGSYGKDRGDFTEEKRKRAVYASMLFPYMARIQAWYFLTYVLCLTV